MDWMASSRYMLFSFLFFIVASPAEAGTWVVGGKGGMPSLQATIDAARAFDTIWVVPGTWGSATINKPLTIERYPTLSGVAIIGDSTGAVRVDLHDGERVVLRNLTLVGSNGPVVRGATWITSGRAPNVVLDNVDLWWGTVGISSYMNLKMLSVNLYNPLGAGIAIRGGVDLRLVKVIGAAGDGIAITTANSGALVNSIREVQVLDSDGVGIRITGHIGPTFSIRDVRIDDATGAGVLLDRADGAVLDGLRVNRTRQSFKNEKYPGDGVITVNAVNVKLDNSIVKDSSRAGISVYGCKSPGLPADLTATWLYLIRNPIHAVADPWWAGCDPAAMDAKIYDGGNIYCWDTDSHPEMCVVRHSFLSPPEPPWLLQQRR
jgi:hypothetical protein